ncbi:hypothetical protein KP509_1Z086000 [Ceratopteris richardii]|nr:hypothetical protein KP509_1Z086000 [Ceratopteris richardii]KAH6557920.1 hypothetical protein KP509_1Z086000 [Ceratopteris richardii]KAH6557921.1 hypothetical protein KP509_1Z086000 [Ceratopteris richardii]KAH6557922.1 hypothetical protein KP509_1Z086000 [Ceratopteris richardii]KAH6557923.1 hypothetical protein KP509_1Z086000 [Ceratopteris richardii]
MALMFLRLSRKPRRGWWSFSRPYEAERSSSFILTAGACPSSLPRVGSTISSRHLHSFLQRGFRDLYGPVNPGRSPLQLATFCTQIQGRGSIEEGNVRKVASTSWVHRLLPARVLPFALLIRLDKPIGTWLLAWPCMWSITLATPAGSLPDFKLFALFGVGAFLLRGAGCTINDLIDRDIDSKVERTKMRPITSGAITPFQGLSFIGLQLLLGLGILLQLNTYSRASLNCCFQNQVGSIWF